MNNSAIEKAENKEITHQYFKAIISSKCKFIAITSRISSQLIPRKIINKNTGMEKFVQISEYMYGRKITERTESIC